ncbi:MAG TPA: glycosyltransferase, partial [Gammaproteobacteria bacterium]|nr:glycosyltransferase [Gammaproteobacteria bacterium]
DSASLRDYMQRARALVFAAEEDFGILPVEAQACGTPVIAYGKGGARETVVGIDEEHPTGVFFENQTVDSLCRAVDLFESECDQITSEACRGNAERFSEERFRREFQSFVLEHWQTFRDGIN